MKRSDISDRQALEAAHRGSYSNSLGPDEPPSLSSFSLIALIVDGPRDNVWQRLHDRIGPYPWKVGLRKMEQIDDRGWIECGTSLNYAWRTEAGNDELARLRLEDTMRYGKCRACLLPPAPTRIVDEERKTITVALGCGICVLAEHARAEAARTRGEFLERLQEEGNRLAEQLTEEMGLPEGIRGVFEIGEDPSGS